MIKINERINYFYLQGSPGIPSLNRTLQEEENGTMAGFTENDFKWICNSFIHSFNIYFKTKINYLIDRSTRLSLLCIKKVINFLFSIT